MVFQFILQEKIAAANARAKIGLSRRNWKKKKTGFRIRPKDLRLSFTFAQKISNTL